MTKEQIEEKKALLEELGKFMDSADNALQSNEYEELNKAFHHLNDLYERLQDEVYFAKNNL